MKPSCDLRRALRALTRWTWALQLLGAFSGIAGAQSVPSFTPSAAPVTDFAARTLADLDGDGRLDLVGDQACSLALTTGGFGASIPFPATATRPMAGDIDGDGKLDLIGRDGTAAFRALTGDGTGHFVDGGVVATISLVPSFFTRLSDFNGDGHLDLYVNGIYTPTPNSIFKSVDWIFAGHGDGSFTAVLDAHVDAGKLATLEAGDHDNDGNLDWVSSFWQLNSVRVTHGDGAGSIAGTQAVPVGQFGVQDLTMGDVNGDGASDLVVPFHDHYQFPDPFAISIVLNSGALQLFYAPDAMVWSGMADLNGDGAPEPYGHNGSSVLFTLVNMSGGAFGNPTSVPLTGPHCQILVADLTGDGRPDLIEGIDDSQTVPAMTRLHVNTVATPLPWIPWVGESAPWGVPVAAVPSPVLEFRGSGFANALGILVNGIAYGSSSVQVSTDGNTLSLTLSPPPAASGVATLHVVTTAGTASPVKYPLRRAARPVLIVDPPQPIAGQPATLYFAGPTPGNLVLAVASGCQVSVPAPPYFTLDIGGCGDLELLPSPPAMDSSGLTQLTVTVPPTLVQTTVYLQFCDVELAALLTNNLPLAVSNVVAVVFP